MSAAEKLKALDEAIERQRLLGTMNYYFGPGARTAVSRESVQMYHNAKTVLSALPQIVAVVEAAELLRDRLDCPGYVMDALAALEEALS